MPRWPGTDIAVATVVNFPAGTDSLDAIVAETRQALADGADEIDLVVPFPAAIAGDLDAVESTVRRIDEVCGDHHLKAILETGALGDPELIAEVARRAVAGGADFCKTTPARSTSAPPPTPLRRSCRSSPTPTAPSASSCPAGSAPSTTPRPISPSSTTTMGADWVSPATVRFGASSLLDDLLAAR